MALYQIGQLGTDPKNITAEGHARRKLMWPFHLSWSHRNKRYLCGKYCSRTRLSLPRGPSDTFQCHIDPILFRYFCRLLREREREKEIHLYRLVLLECQLELIYKSLDLVMAPRTSLGRLPHRMTAYASSGKSELHYCTIFTIILS